MRKFRPAEVAADEEWQVVYQIVVPNKYRREILSLAHQNPFSGHLGINKTTLKVLQHFYWPGLRRDVKQFCKTCYVCQMVAKPNQVILKAPSFDVPFKLAVDASEVGIGAVLLQDDKGGVEHPVAFYSKKLNRFQKKYSTIEKETLGLILALQHFEIYVTSSPSPLTVFTDHNPIKFIHKFKNKNQRLTRWSLFLQEYDLDIQHIKGKDNIIADALSRV